MINKVRLFVMTVCWLGGGLVACAEPLSSAEQALIPFYIHVRTIDAIRVDIERFALYHKGNKGLWEERIAQDLAELRLAKAEVQEHNDVEEVGLLRSSFLSAAEALEAYAGVFLRAGDKEAYIAEELLARRHERLRNHLDQIAGAILLPPQLEEDFDPADEEVKAFPDLAGRELFSKAAFLLEEKRFDVAWAELAKLREAYRGTEAEGPIVLRMVRCMLRDHAANLPSHQEKAQIQMLEDLIASRVYYPNCFDIYLEWRALYQGFYYGVSTDAEIPNLQYLAKLRTVVATVRQHIETVPQDAWARSQLWMLLQLPVIERSGQVTAGAGIDLFGAE